MTKIKKILMVIAVGGVFFTSAWWILAWRVPIQTPRVYGVTFSSFYAEQFGLDWKKTYLALFEDLGIQHVRIPAYWNDTEKFPDQFDFAKLDWQINEARKHNSDVILAIGRKLPRWPECHDPEWAKELILKNTTDNTENKKKFNSFLIKYLEAVVSRYRDSAAVTVWQIENEPYLPFGDCTDYNRALIDEEIKLVRSLDPSRPIMITDSGELSLWIKAALRADVFGSTMYRSVYNKIFGYITYPLPPSFFRAKRAFTELVVGKKPMIVVELQGEPWSREATYTLSVDDHYKTMNPEKFRDVLHYASQAGFDTFYLWGAEWWYWLKTTQHQPEMWNIAKDAIAKIKQ